MKTVFISGGGTGGHYYPALAVAEALKEKGYKVVYIGTTVGIEAKKGFPAADNTYLFEMKAVRGKSFLGKIEGILSLIKTTFKVIKLIKKENPSFSICFGGYTSFPLGVASFLTRKDLYIHEQNSIPSYTNRVLSIFAKKVFITFDYSRKFFNTKKTYHVGLPLRKSIIERAKTYTYKPKERKTVLIFGGSQGSKKLSEIAIEMAKSMPDKDFILIKGKWDLNVPNLPNLTVYDYYDKMEELYELADIVVSRSGSGTVNEVLAFGKYAIFIPYPYAASNHQYYNVKWLYDLGLCDILEEKEVSADRIIKIIQNISDNKLLYLHVSLRNYARLSAVEEILSNIER
ncbi:UDP-N-acetylglucosamine--N-acetylmuramyl-(pentapeptide) pyrophosphoryl-undecaprenol N-acetylglucosamine transferase [Sulfurihydrogenibium sp.]|uniref:undecaprenyldiphospho-muramoylpentapeptide beta-N-acetylglucosaminyltransferase n=1 Tax=Sulfurihydrogenibium sp. TaxID=2053621 RepID=UPI000CAD5F07|nr:MAG: undecaprenyldiphospho-muramoylpentapeptide beta-N-acetylglucosaminyltransferase [Sulfurihydrogenibium sp.]